MDACHRAGVAVILDSVYEHVDDEFPYRLVYEAAQLPSPFLGHFAANLGFGSKVDFEKPLTRDYFRAVNAYWMDEYHVDGFRYDYVPGYYYGPTGQGYAGLVMARWLMLETIREYMLEQLEANGDIEQLRERHARYYLAIVERSETALHGAEQLRSLG